MLRLAALSCAVCALVSGCSVGIDDQVFGVSILNDTPHTVVISTCNTSCSTGGVVDTATLRTGASARENESSEEAPNDYVVDDVTLSRRYCFRLEFNSRQEGRVIALSQVVSEPCP
jgi:hypothetical protein